MSQLTVLGLPVPHTTIGLNGSVKVSQKAVQNVAIFGLGILPHRRAPASGQPRLSYSWRLPGCFGPSGPITCDVGAGLGFVLAGLALAKAVAVAIHLKDVHVVGQSIQESASEAF